MFFPVVREAEFSWPLFFPARLSLGVCSGQLAQNLVTDKFTKHSIFSVLPQNAGAASPHRDLTLQDSVS